MTKQYRCDFSVCEKKITKRKYDLELECPKTYFKKTSLSILKLCQRNQPRTPKPGITKLTKMFYGILLFHSDLIKRASQLINLTEEEFHSTGFYLHSFPLQKNSFWKVTIFENFYFYFWYTFLMYLLVFFHSLLLTKY